ncbi:hypothetical protein ES319_A03G190700v1 [Gossypium barbadense]|uniref:Leucine-rich repeat-containing N-terminal plant-type domain-containing protein n=1 Tax=Gossypium barbadense TaxID=3634 RepID=A0A5J5WJ18_GOSBA|nr:hypothetical protein ES319_A03G190700v1 [Gossypium barbadense]
MGVPTMSLVFILLAVMLQQMIQASQEPACHMNDLTALKGFTKCLEQDIGGWNWSSSNCCSFTGITCDNSSVIYGRVVGLELGNKRLTGTICESLVGLEQFRILNLSLNSLHGKIPANLFRFRNLEVLDLSNNYLVGPLPSAIHLPSIKYLDLSKNYFSSFISMQFCTSSSHIQYLDLARNFFGEGSIYLENCTSLQYVFLNGNVTDGIGNLSNLVELNISLNDFSGSLPDVFGRLRKLESFSASSNRLTGLLPASLVNSVPLLRIDLHNNSLDGPIRINCSAMAQVTSLHLGSNNFQGPVPASLSSCQSLTVLHLARNKLGGVVPFEFRNLHALEFLSLGNTSINNISTALDILQHCKNLTILDLGLNFYQEEMPSNVNLQFTSLTALIIPFCHLRGSLPIWLSSSKMLQLLDLSWNSLGGSLPSRIGKFEYLFYLDLSNNSFSGEIPESLTGLENLVHKTALLKESCEHISLIKSKEQGRPRLFTGPIWPSFGNLKNLHVLNLEENNLSGSIPDSISGMTSLEVLDLSCNNLSGEIPYSLVHLSFLSVFNVSYNRLYGDTPSGGQFMTFPDSSFDGNQALCPRLVAPCQRKQIHPVVSPGKKMKIMDWNFGIGAAIGFLLCVFFCFKSGWVIPKGRVCRC